MIETSENIINPSNDTKDLERMTDSLSGNNQNCDESDKVFQMPRKRLGVLACSMIYATFLLGEAEPTTKKVGTVITSHNSQKDYLDSKSENESQHISKSLVRAASAGIEKKLENTYLLEVNKINQKATLYQISYQAIEEITVSTGKIPGNKQMQGDNKTPEGLFIIESIEISENWIRNGRKAYGPYFLRLDTGNWDSKGNYNPHGRSSIGLHGTDEPEKLGTRQSEGCIRIDDSVLTEYLKKGYLSDGTHVQITDERIYQNGWLQE